jgi:biopolymer transport protein ExbD
MSVGVHQLAPGTFNRHLMARAYKKSKGKRLLLISLSLTAMVDMFSLLVIFLLQSFASSPELLIVTKGVILPSARSGLEIKDAPLISIAQDGIYLDQVRVGETAQVLREPKALLAQLESLREKWLKSHPGQVFKGEINLQAHREIPSTTVSQLMGLLPSQNYSSIQLAVVSGGN